MAFTAVTYPRRGDVYLASLDKDRPVVIISTDALNKHALDVCVVPITSVQHAQFTVRVPLSKGDAGLHFNCWAKCDQITTLEKDFLHTKPLGTLSAAKFQEIEKQVKIALGR
jgi:mRNA-degrading endonuclease toxin of MazEF toxin-antitoxin module